MGESKSPALPLGDGASCKTVKHIFRCSTRGAPHFCSFFCALPAALAAVWVGFWALRPGPCVFHILPCFYERQVLRDAFFKKHSPQGAQDSYCKGEIYFFPDFSYYFLKRLYFLLRFWYTGCDKNKLKKLRRCPGCPRAGQCLHLCEGKRGIS